MRMGHRFTLILTRSLAGGSRALFYVTKDEGKAAKTPVFPLFFRIFQAKPLIRPNGYAIIETISGLQIIGTET